MTTNGLTPEQTARLVADRINGVDTLTQAYQALVLTFKEPFDCKDEIIQYFVFLHLDLFVPNASTVGDHMKNELFTLKVKLQIDRHTCINTADLYKLENKIHQVECNLNGLGLR